MSKVAAWADTLPRLIDAEPTSIMDALRSFVPDATLEQLDAWRESVRVLQQQGVRILQLRPSSRESSAVLEYELPREGGRRPDVVVLQNGRVVVLEFKSTDRPRRSDIDQVSAYARDLRSYHSACTDVEVVPALVVPSKRPTLTVDGVSIVGASSLADWLVSLGGEGPIVQLDSFVRGEYAPLPTLVAAARMLFENLELPFIRRARSAGVAESVQLILECARTARERRERHLVLLTGVPGAGKTLVGLQVAHSSVLRAGGSSARGAPATFLSGNGPLVQVLQDALKSRTFVRDMHSFIREHGLKHPDRVPAERVIIFDEAQRAWDAAKIEDFYKDKLTGSGIDLKRSEPQLLIEIAERMKDGCLVLGLVGTGQEIHTGEEGGMAQWADAIRGRNWKVHGPHELAPHFRNEAYEVHPRLTLDTTLRAHAASDLHDWVASVIRGDVSSAEALSTRMRLIGFPIYVVQSLEDALRYARNRFPGEPLKRYGLLASSRADRFLLQYGIDCGFQATKKLKIGPWFNAPPDHPLSCCQLNTTATEFQSQGLELDLPIVCWGDDFSVQKGKWALRSGMRPNKLIRDPLQLRTNAYRVLLTRGREGLVLFVPPAPMLRETFELLRACGAVVPSSEISVRAS